MSNSGLFGDDWLQLQQKYWEGWTEMGRKAMGVEQPRTNPWEAAMDHWWKALSPAASDPARHFMERLLEQGKAYFGVLGELTKGIGGLGGDDAPKTGWEAMDKTLQAMQKAFTGGMPEGDDALRQMMGFWEMPLDNWQRMISSLSPLPGDFLRNMPHDSVQGGFDRMLSAPGLGYTREEQGQYQDLVRRGMDYQKAMQDYAGFFNQIGLKSLQRMRDFLQAHSHQGETINSGRALYDAWIRCCEDTYAEEVGTPEYARIHGQLVNAQMALKKRMSLMVDEQLGAMNMPTRSELRTLQDRLQETRRENKRLQRDLEGVKRALAGLVGNTASAPEAPPARPRAGTAKKTAARRRPTTKTADD